jgi:hypothetical protein
MHSVRRPRDHVPQRAFAVALAPCSAAARLPGTRDHEGLKLQAWDKKKGFHTVIYHSPIIFSTTKSAQFACLSNRGVVKITVVQAEDVLHEDCNSWPDGTENGQNALGC